MATAATTDHRTLIINTVATMLHGVDDLDWDTVRSALTAEVSTDYTSLWGGSAEHLPADELVARWQQLLPGFDATHHLIGPVVVTDLHTPAARCTTNVRAYHRLTTDGNAETWMVAGRYHLALAHDDNSGWRISALTLSVAYEDGDRRLVDAAQARAAAGGGRT